MQGSDRLGPIDIVILALVAALLALAVRSLARSGKGGCSGCGSASSCSAHNTGAPCPAASDMLRRAEGALGKKGER